MAKTPRILVVDDDALIRELVTAQLTRFGYETVTACDGEEAYTVFLREKPGAVICDIMMPKVDGFEFCKRLRSEGFDVPFLFLSAQGAPRSVASALDSGGDMHLAKPFDPLTLEFHLSNLLKRAQRK